jgi:A/G-specific adenine glycosylase
MLQQTRVDTVIPYFERFLKRFPTLEALARADLDQVLESWAGLGYYSRARNLHKGAGQVVSSGAFPRTIKELKALPGVGDYVAGAIASIALGLDVATVDGNIERVLSRVHCTTGRRSHFFELAAALLVKGRAGDFNQALMDLGATICTPRSPKCSMCPIARHCMASHRRLQSSYPPPRVRKAPRPCSAVALVLAGERGMLLARRPESGLFGGLFDLPGDMLEQNEDVRSASIRVGQARLGVAIQPGRELASITHTLSHMRITLHLVECQWEGEPQSAYYTGFRWVEPRDALNMGISTLAMKAVKVIAG